MPHEHPEEFERVLEEARELQKQLPWLNLVAVGGTAAAIHAHHRYSLDSDQVTPNLSDNYEEVLDELVRWEGWQTNRAHPPFVILGERHGVELGIRQQIRPVPLEIERVKGLIIPTAEETLRIKAYLAYRRRAVRDFLDIAALVDNMGKERALEALKWLNVLYEGQGNQTAITKFADAVHQPPRDLNRVNLASYRGLSAPYTDWEYVRQRCQEIGAALFLREMAGDVPTLVEEFIAHQRTATQSDPEPQKSNRERGRHT